MLCNNNPDRTTGRSVRIHGHCAGNIRQRRPSMVVLLMDPGSIRSYHLFGSSSPWLSFLILCTTIFSQGSDCQCLPTGFDWIQYLVYSALTGFESEMEYLDDSGSRYHVGSPSVCLRGHFGSSPKCKSTNQEGLGGRGAFGSFGIDDSCAVWKCFAFSQVVLFVMDRPALGWMDVVHQFLGWPESRIRWRASATTSRSSSRKLVPRQTRKTSPKTTRKVGVVHQTSGVIEKMDGRRSTGHPRQRVHLYEHNFWKQKAVLR